MKKYSLLLVCLVLSMVAMSQKAVISSEEKTHDFGKVNEEDGKITYVFDFVNRGNSPLVVNRVQASCGCTTPTWTKEPIEPGKKGSVTVTYNPQGRPGVFTKTITVYSNAAEEQFVLTIHGEVIGKQGDNASAYPVNMGGLLSKSKVVQMNNVDKGKIQTRTIEIQNGTKTPLKPAIENLPAYITYSVSPETLKPGEEGKITFTFNSKSCAQWGPVTDDVYVALNGAKRYSEEFKLTVVSNVVEDFGKMTLDQKRKAPILEIPLRTISLSTIKQGTKRAGKFKVNNKGQNSLEIRRIINNSKELAIRPQKMSVASGRSAEIIVDLNTKNLTEGDYKKSFTVQTNDPDNSFLILIVSWKIQK
jgi:hypothetical protein